MEYEINITIKYDPEESDYDIEYDTEEDIIDELEDNSEFQELLNALGLQFISIIDELEELD